jgi:hypothetical protein
MPLHAVLRPVEVVAAAGIAAGFSSMNVRNAIAIRRLLNVVSK